MYEPSPRGFGTVDGSVLSSFSEAGVMEAILRGETICGQRLLGRLTGLSKTEVRTMDRTMYKGLGSRLVIMPSLHGRSELLNFEYIIYIYMCHGFFIAGNSNKILDPQLILINLTCTRVYSKPKIFNFELSPKSSRCVQPESLSTPSSSGHSTLCASYTKIEHGKSEFRTLALMSKNAAFGDSPETPVHPSTTNNNNRQPTPEEAIDEGTYANDSGNVESFDPDTLAGIAALSRIVQDGAFDGDVEGDDVDADYPDLLSSRVTREQIQDIVNGLGASDSVNEADVGEDKDVVNGGLGSQDDKDEADLGESNGNEEEMLDDEKNSDDESRSGEDDGELLDPRYVFKGGRLKRRRNRTTL